VAEYSDSSERSITTVFWGLINSGVVRHNVMLASEEGDDSAFFCCFFLADGCDLLLVFLVDSDAFLVNLPNLPINCFGWRVGITSWEDSMALCSSIPRFFDSPLPRYFQ